MGPDISKVDTDRHLDLSRSAWNFRDEVLQWLFMGNSLSDPKDLLIPFSGTNPEIAANFCIARRSVGISAIISGQVARHRPKPRVQRHRPTPASSYELFLTLSDVLSPVSHASCQTLPLPESSWIDAAS
jgi:hypothetical protein